MGDDDYFEKHASEWEEIRKGYFDESIRNEAIKICLPTRDMTVVDMGCGAGYMTEALAPLVQKVFAIDPSPAMLSELAKRLPFPNIETHVGDMEHIPLPLGSVDAVFGNMVLHHAPHPERAILDCARVLKKGGMLIVTDMDAHDNEWMRQEMADLWLGFDRATVKGWMERAGLAADVGCAGRCCGASSDGMRVGISVFLAAGRKV